MFKNVILLCAAVITVTACAPRASEIAPAPVSSLRYDGWGCAKMAKEQVFIEESLSRVSADQDAAADRDALMVFLIGVPTSGGGVKGQVADMKGQKEAVRRALMEQGCL